MLSERTPQDCLKHECSEKHSPGGQASIDGLELVVRCAMSTGLAAAG